MIDLKDKVVIVTGGGGLIGKSIIQKINEAQGIGINVDITAVNESGSEFVKCDIRSEEDIKEAISTVVKNYGRLDGLVNSAYPRTSDWGLKFEDIAYDSWKTNVDWQLNSCFYFCQQAFVEMKKNRSGSIINIGSVYGSIAPDFNIYKGTQMTSPAAYSVIKGGITNLTRYMASYFGKYGIRVNTVSPGGVFDKQPVEFVDNYISKTPLGRMSQPEDISPTVAFLLSDQTSYITGQNFIIDGGFSII